MFTETEKKTITAQASLPHSLRRKVQLAQGTFEQLSFQLWQISAKIAGFPFSQNMHLYALKGGGLALHNPIPVDLSPIRNLVSKENIKVLLVTEPATLRYLPHYLEVHACENTMVFTFDKFLSSFPASFPRERLLSLDSPLLKEMGIEVFRPEGLKEGFYAMSVETEVGPSLLVNSFLTHHQKLQGFLRWFAWALQAHQGLSVPRNVIWYALKDKEKFKNWIIDLAQKQEWELIGFTLGEPIKGLCAEKLFALAEKM